MRRESTAWCRVLGAVALVAAACSTDAEELPALDTGPPVRRPNPYADAGDEQGRDGGRGPGGGSTLLYSGGTRLRAVYRETAGGASSFAGFVDSTDGASCAFTVAGDGELRCLPAGDGQAYASPGYFADAACTEPIATYGVRPCVSPARMIRSNDRSACPARTRLHALGQRLPSTTAYYKNDAGACQQTTFSTGTELYAIGAELSPSTWVKGQKATAAPSTGVTRVDVVAEDGARGLHGFLDTDRGTECAFRIADDGAPRCFPLSDAYVSTSVFSDAACQSTAASRSTSACAAPSVALSTTLAGCESQTKALVAGARVTPYFFSGSCKALGTTSGVDYLGVGAAVPSSSFPAGTIAPPAGTGRVRAVDLVVPGGARYASKLRDSQREGDCAFGVAGDGALRCLPTATMSTQYFADAACTDRVASRFDQGGCAVVPTSALVLDETTCPPRARIHGVGGARSLTRAYVKSDSTCYGFTPTFTTYYTLGPEVPPTDFPAATTVQR